MKPRVRLNSQFNLQKMKMSMKSDRAKNQDISKSNSMPTSIKGDLKRSFTSPDPQMSSPSQKNSDYLPNNAPSASKPQHSLGLRRIMDK